MIVSTFTFLSEVQLIKNIWDIVSKLNNNIITQRILIFVRPLLKQYTIL